MELIDLIKKYPKVSPDILKQYKEAEKFIIFNEDPNLHPIKVKLPECPELHKIYGFGKPSKDQKFELPTLPKKLAQLTNKFKTLDDIRNELKHNQYYYKEEIQFIKRQWQYFLYGYWFFNNGIPTYIDGWHWFYCSWWNIDTGVPRYHSRDRKFFIFARFCYTDTTAFYRYRLFVNTKYVYFPLSDVAAEYCKMHKLDFHLVEKGEYLVNLGRRTCFGMVYAKYRREGATFKSCCLNYCITITHKNALGGIQSMTDEDAKVVYLKLTSSWRKLPFFFKPNYEGSTDPKKELSFNVQGKKLSNSGSIANIEVGLESKINFGIADGSAYNGQKLYFHHRDEAGQMVNIDIVQCQSTTRECLSTNMGLNIIGLGVVTTTVELMESNATNFKKYCEQSRYEIRDNNGHTQSGYYLCYIPAEDGVVVDEYGNSIIENPITPLRSEDGIRITEGGRNVIMNSRKLKLDQGDYEGLAKITRQFNNSYEEIWSSTGQESGLPVGKVLHRLVALSINNTECWRGNFRWTEGFGSRVEFEHDELGKWMVSLKLETNQSNLKYWDSTKKSWIPGNGNKFVLGIDGIKYNVPDGERKSKGAGAIFYLHDSSIDPYDDFKKWGRSCRFILTYSHRTFDKEEFHDDMLKTAIYYGCKVFPEYNIPDAGDYFIDKKFAEFLIYRFDSNTLREALTPGASFANNRYKEEMFLEYSTHLDRHCHREVHTELLVQVKDIKNPTETNKFDLFTAGGWALIGAKNIFTEFKPIDNSEQDLKKYIKTYRY